MLYFFLFFFFISSFFCFRYILSFFFFYISTYVNVCKLGQCYFMWFVFKSKYISTFELPIKSVQNLKPKSRHFWHFGRAGPKPSGKNEIGANLKKPDVLGGPGEETNRTWKYRDQIFQHFEALGGWGGVQGWIFDQF